MKIKVALLVMAISINGILASCGSAQTTGSLEEKTSSSAMSSSSVDETLIHTRSPSATIAPTRIVTSEPTDQHTEFKVIEANCPMFVSKQEVDLDDGFIIFDSMYPNYRREYESVSILNTRTGELQKAWSNEFAAPARHNISPDKTKYLYLDNNSLLHISSLDGKEFPIAYWDSAWGPAVGWFDNERLYIRPQDEWRNGTLIILDPFIGSWEKLEYRLPSGLNTFRPYVGYNQDLSIGLYICGENYCLWDVNSGTDISMFRSTFPNFVWRLPERDKVAMKISEDMYGMVGELLVTEDTGHPLLYTNFGELYSQSEIIYIEDFNWSPDGLHIAFSISFDEPELGELMIIDVEANNAVNYCVQVPQFSPIIWSPDSRQVLVTRPINTEEYLRTAHTPDQHTGEVVLIDIEESIAIIIFDESIATGWMVLPE